MMQAVFVWETAYGSPERVAWLKENYNKPISFEEYVAVEHQLPHNHKRPSRCTSPSAVRKTYAHLKEKFGFFTPEARAT